MHGLARRKECPQSNSKTSTSRASEIVPCHSHETAGNSAQPSFRAGPLLASLGGPFAHFAKAGALQRKPGPMDWEIPNTSRDPLRFHFQQLSGLLTRFKPQGMKPNHDCLPRFFCDSQLTQPSQRTRKAEAPARVRSNDLIN